MCWSNMTSTWMFDNNCDNGKEVPTACKRCRDTCSMVHIILEPKMIQTLGLGENEWGGSRVTIYMTPLGLFTTRIRFNSLIRRIIAFAVWSSNSHDTTREYLYRHFIVIKINLSEDRTEARSSRTTTSTRIILGFPFCFLQPVCIIWSEQPLYPHTSPLSCRLVCSCGSLPQPTLGVSVGVRIPGENAMT